MTQPDAQNRFVLGTAQIGMAYGAMNQRGMQADGQSLIAKAIELGVTILDTAQTYGNSETFLGELIAHPEHGRFDVISKIDPGVDARQSDRVVAAAKESATRLGGPLYGLMYHDAEIADYWRDGPGDGLRQARDAGHCRKIGISTYSPAQFARAAVEPDIDIIQAPFNVLDRRLEKDRLVEMALDRGCEIHFRSLFLQGLLIVDQGSIPERLSFAWPWVQKLASLCDKYSVSREEVAIGYVRQRYPDARLVVGCDDDAQLVRNFSLMKRPVLPRDLVSRIERLEIPPESVVNPALWPTENECRPCS